MQPLLKAMTVHHIIAHMVCHMVSPQKEKRKWCEVNYMCLKFHMIPLELIIHQTSFLIPVVWLFLSGITELHPPPPRSHPLCRINGKWPALEGRFSTPSWCPKCVTKSHIHAHSHTLMGGWCQAHWKQVRVQCLAKDTSTCGQDSNRWPYRSTN